MIPAAIIMGIHVHPASLSYERTANKKKLLHAMVTNVMNQHFIESWKIPGSGYQALFPALAWLEPGYKAKP